MLQFTRDWIGPREQLVPFGARATETAERRPRSDLAFDAEPALPPCAEDFWGEDSAAVQDALQAPAAAEPLPTLTKAVSRRPHRRRKRPRVRVMWAIGAGLTALGVIALVLVSGPATPVAQHNQASALTRSLAPGTGSKLISPRDLASALGQRQTSHRRAKPKLVRVVDARPRHARSEGHRHRAAKSDSQPRTASVESIMHRAPSSPSTAVAPSESVGATQSAGSDSGASVSSESAAGSATSAGSGGAAGASSAPAGPVGAGAPFGPGHLG